MSKEKILILLPHIGTGGDWTFVRTLSKELRQRGYELHLGASNIQSGVEALYSKNVNLGINRGVKGFLQSLTQILKFDEDVSIIHANSTNTLLYAILLRLLRCRKSSVVFTFHLYLEDDPVRLRLKNFLFNWTDCLHCSSLALKKHIQKNYQNFQNKITLIHLGVDEKSFYKVSQTEREGFRKRLNLSENEFILLFAGRLNPEKNINLILETIAIEKDRYPNLRLLIAGTGPSKADLESTIRKENLESYVCFIGYEVNMRALYGACDLLVLPSRERETFGLVIVEAALCGLPSLRSDTSGAKDQIIDGINGLVYVNNDSKHFHTQLTRALANPEHVKIMGESAYIISMEKFTSSKMGEQFDTLYRKMLDRKMYRN